jgi:hypothetical protein
MFFYYIGIVFPRLTILIAWLSNAIPNNDVPFLLDFVCAFFAPRILIAYYSHLNNMHPLITGLLVSLQVYEWIRAATRQPKVTTSKTTNTFAGFSDGLRVSKLQD